MQNFLKGLLQGENCTEVIVKKSMFKTGLHLEAYGPICFKLGMMIDKTTLFIFVPVWMPVTFTEGQRLWES